MAARWSEALGVKARGGRVELADAVLEFRPGTEERIVKFLVSVPDAGAALSRAKKAGLSVNGTEVQVGGVGIVLNE